MKKLFFLILVFLIPGKYYAQLGNIVITSAPACFLGPGASGMMTGTPVPGATGYEWKSNVGSSQSIWFNGTPGPFVTAIPSVNVLCNLPQAYFEICVRAFNALDTSQWSCIQITGILAPPVLLPANNPVGIPGTSGYYAILSQVLCASQYTWTITGNATFSNNSQVITLPSAQGYGVNVNFSPNFTTGTLCVAALSTFGLPSDTVCMIITVPVGINEPVINFSFVSGQDKVVVEFTSSTSEKISVRMLDVSGKRLSAETITIKRNQNHLVFSTAHLGPGIYFLELTGKSIRKQFRFVLTE